MHRLSPTILKGHMASPMDCGHCSAVNLVTGSDPARRVDTEQAASAMQRWYTARWPKKRPNELSVCARTACKICRRPVETFRHRILGFHLSIAAIEQKFRMLLPVFHFKLAKT